MLALLLIVAAMAATICSTGLVGFSGGTGAS